MNQWKVWELAEMFVQVEFESLHCAAQVPDLSWERVEQCRTLVLE